MDNSLIFWLTASGLAFIVGTLGGYLGSAVAYLKLKTRVLALETEFSHLFDSHIREVRKRASDTRWDKTPPLHAVERPPQTPEEIEAWFNRGGR